MLGDSAGQQAGDFVLVQGAADDDDGATGFGHLFDVRRLRGGVHLVPGFSVPVKALDPQDPAVEGIGEEPGGFLKQGTALQGEVQEGQGLESRPGAGSEFQTVYGIRGEEITVPECKDSIPCYEFTGWVDSEGEILMPGDKIATDYYTPAVLLYTAQWEHTGEVTAAAPGRAGPRGGRAARTRPCATSLGA